MRTLAMFELELEVIEINEADTYRPFREGLPVKHSERPLLEVVRYSGNLGILSDFSILRPGPALTI